GASSNSPYTVEITVTDDGVPSESATVSFTWNVTDVAINLAPVAVASADVLSGVSPLTISFTGSNSTDDLEVVSYSWDFGTGDTSLISDPEYTFEFAGIFEVTLIVTDEQGLTDSIVIEIEVSENEVYDATMDNMVISPNPASEVTQIFINLEEPAPLLAIYIYDTSGRLVKKYDYLESFNGNGSYDMYIGDLRNEIYTVYAFIQGINEPFVKKLVVRN
ncbi:PKD domain-containing protein, partial [Maribacter arcticus]